MSRPAQTQQELPLVLRMRHVTEEEGRQFLKVLHAVVENEGAKIVAEALGIDPSHLANCLAGRGKHFAAEWLPVLMDPRVDREGRILRFLCRATGYEPPRKAVEISAEAVTARALEVLRGEEAGLLYLDKILNPGEHA